MSASPAPPPGGPQLTPQTTVLVVGAGIMGVGIAQVAALAGHEVRLFDLREGAAADAASKLAQTLRGLVSKGRLGASLAEAAIERVQPVTALEAAADVGLVVEAIVEKLEAKRALFAQLESLVSARTVLATNTSSISVTAIARGLQHPGRLVGMHFFNPVPLMKLVEVVSGLHTSVAVADAIFELSRAWGKTPVHTRSTPGFIVNRIARPYYAEALALLLEQALTPQMLDACLRGAGFKMGPCELMDLIGHDTNFAVTQSVYEANFYDKRYMPSLLQREMVDGGLLGRKSGRGFFSYPAETPAADGLPVAVHAAPGSASRVVVHGRGAVADHLEAAATAALAPQGWGPGREPDSAWTGVHIDDAFLVLSDGRTAQQWRADVADVAASILGATGTAGAAAAGGADGSAAAGLRAGLAMGGGGTDRAPPPVSDVAVFDWPVRQPAPPGTALAYALAPGASQAWQEQAPAWLAALGFAPLPVADTPGLVVARTVAMLINEAADAVQQGVCTPAGADAAMKLGVNYPAGPFEWLAAWGAGPVVRLLDRLDAHHRGERYRVSPRLRAAAGA